MSFSMKFRRRREGKTNYHKRLKLLQSGQARFVIRRTNTSTIVQIIAYEPAGDKIVAAANSSEVIKAGLKSSGKSIPASYLTGYLAGKRAVAAGVTGAIVDLGLFTPTKGGRLFAAVKGAVDAGLAIPVSDDVFPAEDRLSGKHIEGHRNVTLDIAALKTKLKA